MTNSTKKIISPCVAVTLLQIFRMNRTSLAIKAIKISILSVISISGRFACTYCTKSYLNMLDYNKHCLKDHLQQIRQDWLACPRCDLFFRNAQGLLLHTKAKHKEADSTNHNFQCSFCPKLFTRIHPMYQHANRFTTFLKITTKKNNSFFCSSKNNYNDHIKQYLLS
jgi:hypothetical protein